MAERDAQRPGTDPPGDEGSQADAHAEARRAAELRAAAAAKGRTAAAKGSVIAHSAAAKSAELASRGAEVRRHVRSLDVPWARCGPARAARETILQVGLGPVIDIYTRKRVVGREQFSELPHPVILVANHSSHLDTPTILRSLPRKWRQRTAVAAAADYFYKKRAVANAVALIFNTVPILRRGGGMGNGSFDHVDRLIEQRWNLVIFPEGTRSRDGGLGRLRSGAAVIAARHGIPIVPVHLKGTHEAMPPGHGWPKRRGGFLSRRHEIVVRFGAPVWPQEGEEHSAVMERVRPFLEGGEITVTKLAAPPAPAAATGERRSVTPAL